MKAQTVDSDDTVAEEQHLVEEPTVVDATHEPMVVAYPDAEQPTLEVFMVEQDEVVPEEAHTTLVIVAVALEHDRIVVPLADLLTESLAESLADGDLSTLGEGSDGGSGEGSGSLSEGAQPLITRPKILTQARFGIFISISGAVGLSPLGGGPGTNPQRATGGPPPGGSTMGITVALCDPANVVVIH